MNPIYQKKSDKIQYDQNVNVINKFKKSIAILSKDLEKYSESIKAMGFVADTVAETAIKLDATTNLTEEQKKQIIEEVANINQNKKLIADYQEAIKKAEDENEQWYQKRK